MSDAEATLTEAANGSILRGLATNPSGTCAFVQYANTSNESANYAKLKCNTVPQNPDTIACPVVLGSSASEEKPLTLLIKNPEDAVGSKLKCTEIPGQGSLCKAGDGVLHELPPASAQATTVNVDDPSDDAGIHDDMHFEMTALQKNQLKQTDPDIARLTYATRLRDNVFHDGMRAGQQYNAGSSIPTPLLKGLKP